MVSIYCSNWIERKCNEILAKFNLQVTRENVGDGTHLPYVDRLQHFFSLKLIALWVLIVCNPSIVCVWKVKWFHLWTIWFAYLQNLNSNTNIGFFSLSLKHGLLCIFCKSNYVMLSWSSNLCICVYSVLHNMYTYLYENCTGQLPELSLSVHKQGRENRLM